MYNLQQRWAYLWWNREKLKCPEQRRGKKPHHWRINCHEKARAFPDSPSEATEAVGPDFPTQATIPTVEVMERERNHGKELNHQSTLQENPLVSALVNQDVWFKWWIKYRKTNLLGGMAARVLWLLQEWVFSCSRQFCSRDVGVLQFTSVTSASRLPGNQLRVSITLHSSTSSHTAARLCSLFSVSVFRTPPRCLSVLNMVGAALRSYPGFTCHWWSCVVPSGQPNWV